MDGTPRYERKTESHRVYSQLLCHDSSPEIVVNFHSFRKYTWARAMASRRTRRVSAIVRCSRTI